MGATAEHGVRTVRLEDVKQLQDLVAEHAEAVQPGLKILDTRVLMGGATVDLVGLDRDQGLALIVLAFAGDDEMLVRGLEAYSWCLEYPDAVTRLYPMARLDASEPPRLIFVAERLPDAFLRKVKHLRLPRATCLEFRFGLQFSAVDGVRAAEAPPGAQAASPAPRTVPAIPPFPATPGWRQPAARVVGEPDERKAAVVREYLQREFPTAVIYDFYEHDRGARVFLLQDSQGSVIHQAAVADEVLEEHSEADLLGFLDRHRLGRVLSQAGQASVSVTRSGLKIDRR